MIERLKKMLSICIKHIGSDEKFVHITSKRFVDRVDNEITVKVYSNCDKVTLYANGYEVATKASNSKIFIFENVALHDGINEIKVVSNQDGIILEDAAIFNKVSEANPSYEAPEAETGGLVANWFEMPELELDDVEVEEIEITNDVYSTRCSLKEILENEEGKAVLTKYLGDFSENPSIGMALGMKIDTLATMAEDILMKKCYIHLIKN